MTDSSPASPSITDYRTHRARAEAALADARDWWDMGPRNEEAAQLCCLQACGHALLALCDELQAITKALYDGRV